MNTAAATPERPLVLIVDDDEAVRLALQELMFSVGLDAAGFASARELLDTALPDRSGCMVLDVRLPGTSGLDLQQLLASNGRTKPIVFLTGHGDIAMSVQAMKAGAVDFLTKPVRDQNILDAVSAAIRPHSKALPSRLRAARALLAAAAGSSSTAPAALARPATSPGANDRPVSPSSTTSPSPPAVEATSGAPAAAASSATIPNGS